MIPINIGNNMEKQKTINQFFDEKMKKQLRADYGNDCFHAGGVSGSWEIGDEHGNCIAFFNDGNPEMDDLQIEIYVESYGHNIDPIHVPINTTDDLHARALILSVINYFYNYMGALAPRGE